MATYLQFEDPPTRDKPKRCDMKFFAIPVVAVLISVTAAGQVTLIQGEYNSNDVTTASIANGDFDGDGILDMVTINYQTLSFYKGLGAGKFANPVNQTVPQNLGQITVADFNRDGKLDLAIASGNFYSSSSSITILLGNGNGTFTQGTNISTTGAPGSIALADFNGDHIPDLAVGACSTSGCQTFVYLGEGNGSFKQSADLSDGGPIVLGDFNADGHQDIALISNGSELVMYLGNGDGTFQSPLTLSVPNAYSLAVGDFYNDRIQSLAVLTAVEDNTFFDNYVSTARYLDGTLEISSPEFIENNYSVFGIAAGDMNGDFKDDIVLTGGQKFGSGSLTYYMLGNGDGTFQSPVSAAAYGEGESFPFVRDLNLDSRHDIGTAWTNGYIVNGGGAFVLMDTNATTNCAPPKANALRVHICAPLNGQTVSSTFTFKAAGNAWNGIAKRMELWIDGKKIGQNLEDQLNVTATLAAGKHSASFLAVDSFDNHATQSISFNVQ
jgi:FG-GAP-like repeat